MTGFDRSFLQRMAADAEAVAELVAACRGLCTSSDLTVEQMRQRLCGHLGAYDAARKS